MVTKIDELLLVSPQHNLNDQDVTTVPISSDELLLDSPQHNQNIRDGTSVPISSDQLHVDIPQHKQNVQDGTAVPISSDKLSLDDIHTWLQEIETNTFEGQILSVLPATVEGGDVYAFQSAESNSKDYRIDGYRWRNVRTYRFVENNICKEYYYILAGTGTQYSKEFKRYIYTMIKPINTKNPGAIIHYVGDSTIYVAKPHQNAKQTKRPFIPTMPSTLIALKNKLKTPQNPKESYESVKVDVRKRIDSLSSQNPSFEEVEASAAPRDLKQARNIKANISSKAKIHKDAIFSLYELCHQDMCYIKELTIFPELNVVFGHEQGIHLANHLIKRSHDNKNLKQLLTYDTTFNVGDFYLSVIVMRNTDIVGDPIFPVLFFIHETKKQECHTKFWRNHVLHLLSLEKYGDNVPIATDREAAIVNAIKTSQKLAKYNLVFCQNHIFGDIRLWLTKHGGKKENYAGITSQLVTILQSESMEQFETLYKEVHQTWPEEFRIYADKHLKEDLCQHSIKAVTQRFAAFKDVSPTNNIAESFNRMIKDKLKWKELMPDALVLTMFIMQTHHLQEFNRAIKQVGNFNIKHAYEDSVCKLNITGIACTSIDDLATVVKDAIPRIDNKPKHMPGYRMSQKALAQLCVDHCLVTFESNKLAYIVENPFSGALAVLKYKGKELTCFCPSTGKCFHKLAVEYISGIQDSVDTDTYQLTKIQKNLRKRKSGRKAPRRGDCTKNISVLPAEDSLIMANQSSNNQDDNYCTPVQNSPALSMRHSTPKNVRSQPLAIALNDKDSPILTLVELTKPDEGNLNQQVKISNPATLFRMYDVPKVDLKELAKINRFKTISIDLDCWIIDDALIRLIKLFNVVDRVARIRSDDFAGLMTDNYEDMVKFTAAHELLNKDWVAVLIGTEPLVGFHWVLGIIAFNLKKVFLLDSLRTHISFRKEIFEHLAKIVAISHAVAKVPIQLEEWEFIYSNDCAQQKSGYHGCGVYCVANMAYILLHKCMPTNFNEVKGRKWIAHLARASNVTSDEIHDIQGISNEIIDDVLQDISYHEWSDITIKEGQTFELYKQLFVSPGDWTYCASLFCFGDESHGHAQIMCVLCRKWYHEDCEAINQGDRKTYAKCENCCPRTAKCIKALEYLSISTITKHIEDNMEYLKSIKNGLITSARYQHFQKTFPSRRSLSIMPSGIHTLTDQQETFIVDELSKTFVTGTGNARTHEPGHYVPDKLRKAEKKLSENPYDLDAWSLIVRDGQSKKIDEARSVFERLVAQFPNAGRYWKIYIEQEMKAKNYDRVEKLFQRCLMKVLNIDLWKCYLNYVKETKGTFPSFREKMAQAYDFALEKMGMDICSYPIWSDYVQFLKGVDAIGSYAEGQKISAVRRVYQRGCVNPMINIEQLWKDYVAFEQGLNPMLAEKMIADKSREYMNARRVAKEYEAVTRGLNRNAPSIPPQNTPEETRQVELWKKYIAWEKANSLRTEDHTLITKRVMFAYEQSLLCLGHHPDIWYEAALFLEQSSKLLIEKGDVNAGKLFSDEAAAMYERAFSTLLKTNMLLYFAYADFEEGRMKYDKVHQIYNKYLEMTDVDPTLAYIQYMKFTRRAEGIKSARLVFKKAREDQRSNHHVYVAAALMEYYCSKDKNVAFKIFELGLKKYGDNPDYILAYVDYLSHLNEDNNTRVLFERVLTSGSLPSEKSVETWNKFLEFESNIGDLASVLKVEKRRAAVIDKLQEFQGKETALLVDRYKYLDLYPCTPGELRAIGYKDFGTSNALQLSNLGRKEVITLPDDEIDVRPNYPKPDISQMIPFKPRQISSKLAITRNIKQEPGLAISYEGSGSHPVSGGVFPVPPAAAHVLTLLPPPTCFHGPFVHIEALMETFRKCKLPELAPTPSENGVGKDSKFFEYLTHFSNDGNRKRRHGAEGNDESEDEDGQLVPPAYDIYRSRQQKRVK